MFPVTSLDKFRRLGRGPLNALHQAHPGQAIDGRALAAALIASGLGVLRDVGHPNPQDFVQKFTAQVNLDDTQPFNREMAD